MELPPGSRAFDALSRAGGIKVDLIEKARVTIVRRMPDGNPAFLQVNAEKLMTKDDKSQNAVLQNGDIINVVEAAEQSAVVTGKIIKPGPVILPEGGQDIATVIARAGGQTPDASLRNVTIKRADGRVANHRRLRCCDKRQSQLAGRRWHDSQRRLYRDW